VAQSSDFFVLDVQIDSDATSATLRLFDRGSTPLTERTVRLAEHPASRWEAVFATREHVDRMERIQPAAALLEATGTFLGEHVLGPRISTILAADDEPRTLLVRLPRTVSSTLAESFASIPWELARAPGDTKPFLERNLTVRALIEGDEPAGVTDAGPGADRPLRVLCIISESPDTSPVAARHHRERLRKLFFEEVLRHHDVAIDVLCHGVTRARLEEHLIEQADKGWVYDIVHWLGHGHRNVLALDLEEGETARPYLTGDELVQLFQRAGGFVPKLIFFASCHSGALVRPPEQGKDASKDTAPSIEETLAKAKEYAGTALSLLRAGVTQVVAMRWEVGDTYARRIARRFYRHLLGSGRLDSVDAALVRARKELIDDRERAAHYHPVDHATPLVFGQATLRFTPADRPSAQIEQAEPKIWGLGPSDVRDFHLRGDFVGRSGELTLLHRKWLRAGEAPIALVQGLGGMGKTTLASEVIGLWHETFEHIFVLETKGYPIAAKAFISWIEQRLIELSEGYRQRCRRNEMERIDLSQVSGLDEESRQRRQRVNLIRELRQQRILLVLDNFETNLQLEGATKTYACVDAGWTALFDAMAEELKSGRSRVLVTSRHRPAALTRPFDEVLWLMLGPLPPGDAALYFESLPLLQNLWHSKAEEDQALVRRMLDVTRGHPLILRFLADLAGARIPGKLNPTTARVVLEEALVRIQGEGYAVLPDLAAGAKSDEEKERERAYLEDVTVRAVDLLIERLSPDARRLLWVLTRAGEAVPKSLLEGIWSGMPEREQALRYYGEMLDQIDRLPLEQQAALRTFPAEIVDQVKSIRAKPKPEVPALDPLLNALVQSGMVLCNGNDYTFHELVGERATEWMNKHPAEQGKRSEQDIWVAYGERYGTTSVTWLHRAARESAVEAGRRGIRYMVQARAFERLGGFASVLVTSTHDPTLLASVITHLQAIADEVPPGDWRWRMWTYLADALLCAGHPAQALRYYEKAAEEAEDVGRWSDVGWICHNWAGACVNAGRLDQAKKLYLKSAVTKVKAGEKRMYVLMSEVAALRIDVTQEKAGAMLPEIEARLGEVRLLWEQRQLGGLVFETSYNEELGRVLLGALDVAAKANHDLERWQTCLNLLDEQEKVKRERGESEHEIARTRVNQHRPLIKLGRITKTKEVLQKCLEIFRAAQDIVFESKALSGLALVWDRNDDVPQAIELERAALDLKNGLPDPGDRAISHQSLWYYLEKFGQVEEAKEHLLAALAYRLVIKVDLRKSVGNLAFSIRQSALRGGQFELPRLADLLVTQKFSAFARSLAERDVDLDGLQAKIDEVVEQVRMQVREAIAAGVIGGDELGTGASTKDHDDDENEESVVVADGLCPCGSGKAFQQCHGAGDRLR